MRIVSLLVCPCRAWHFISTYHLYACLFSFEWSFGIVIIKKEKSLAMRDTSKLEKTIEQAIKLNTLSVILCFLQKTFRALTLHQCFLTVFIWDCSGLCESTESIHTVRLSARSLIS